MLVMIFLAFFILLNRSTAEYVVSDYELKKQGHLMDLYSTNFNSVMLVTEQNTSKQMANLLSDAVFYRDDIINISGGSVNVTAELGELLDEVYGADRYYLEVNPKIIEVSLNFVIDGSPSLEDERERLAAELPTIVKKVWTKINETGNERVTADVFILEDEVQGSSLCNIFPNDKYHHINTEACVILDGDTMYLPEDLDLGNQTLETNSTEYFKHQYNLSAPFSNFSYINSIREGGIKDYYGSDWGTGSAYVSLLRKDAARLVLIFPMGDELSTSSINDDCFDIPLSSFSERAEQKICDICTSSCSALGETTTELRSMKTVEKAIEVATANRHTVNPIFAYSCDYEYKPIFNDQYEEVFGSSTADACGEGNCGGCSTVSNGNGGTSTCFHPECKDDIIAQMNHLATETQGQVIDLVDIENLDYDIENTIQQNVAEYRYSIGERREGDSKYVVSRVIPLPNKMLVDVKLHVYPGDRVI